jgi:hypothetical protein
MKIQIESRLEEELKRVDGMVRNKLAVVGCLQ